MITAQEAASSRYVVAIELEGLSNVPGWSWAADADASKARTVSTPRNKKSLIKDEPEIHSVMRSRRLWEEDVRGAELAWTDPSSLGRVGLCPWPHCIFLLPRCIYHQRLIIHHSTAQCELNISSGIAR